MYLKQSNKKYEKQWMAALESKIKHHNISKELNLLRKSKPKD